MRSPILLFPMSFLFASAAPAVVVKGPYVFDDNAFADDVIATGGDVVGNPADLEDTSAATSVQLRPGAFVDLQFIDNVAVNVPGPDIVIFERFGATPVDVTIEIGGTTQTASGGAAIIGVDGVNVNAIELDLTDFGYADGAVIEDLRIARSALPGTPLIGLVAAIETMPPEEPLPVVAKGPYLFLEDAFVDEVIGKGGTIDGEDADIVDLSAATGVLVRPDSFIDLAFTDNVAINGAGIDIVIFEGFGSTPLDATIEIGGTTQTVSGGAILGVDGSNVNAIEIDLGEFGFADGAVVTELRLSRSVLPGTPNPRLVGALSSASQLLIDFESFEAADHGKRFGVDIDEEYEGVDWAYDQAFKIDTWGSWTVQDVEQEVAGASGSNNWLKARASDVGKGAKITDQDGFLLNSMYLYTDEDRPSFLDVVRITWRATDNTTSSGHVIDLVDDTWIEVTAADLGAEGVELKAIWFEGPGIVDPDGAKFGLDDLSIAIQLTD